MKRKTAYIDAFWHEHSCTVIKNDERHNEPSRVVLTRVKAAEYIGGIVHAAKGSIPIFNHERVFASSRKKTQ